MFTKKEKGLIDKAHFKVIRETEGFVEVISKNTKHCWINHKHSDKDEYYHQQHNRTFTVGQAIHDIKDHDRYVLRHVN